MDPEQTFIRVQERFSEMVSPKIRVVLEYFFLFLAIALFSLLVVMHANYVQQPGCSSELSTINMSHAQLIQIKITSAGLWSHNESYSVQTETAGNVKAITSWFIRETDNDDMEPPSHDHDHDHDHDDDHHDDEVPPRHRFFFISSPKESLKAAIIHLAKKWHARLSFLWRLSTRLLRPLWDIAGINLNFDPNWLKLLYLDRLNSYAVQWLEKRSNAFEPAYLYTMEKGYFLLPEEARSKHSILTINISISARHSCFGNRWQQLLINRLVGYDTILMNSLLDSPGQGHTICALLTYFRSITVLVTFIITKQRSSIILLMLTSNPKVLHILEVEPFKLLFILCFLSRLSCDQVWRIDDVTFRFLHNHNVSIFTLRETQTRMLKFTVQLQHHARHRLPTFQLIFVHVIESLVFVPIMIGILFFLFEFYDDQLLAFMVLILVWICELFTLISVRTPISVKFFPRFFLLYFLVFHIYFFSYTYGFSYLALSTSAAFMQHLILYFWNRFEVPALQRFMQNRRSHFQQHPDFHITSSTILASTLRITRLNTGNSGPVNADPVGAGAGAGSDTQMPRNVASSDNSLDRFGNPLNIGRQPPVLRQAEGGGNPGGMNSFSSLLLWILGGASSESLNSFLSIFRDLRDQGHVYAEPPPPEENRTGETNQ